MNNPFKINEKKPFAIATARLLHKIFNSRGVDPQEVDKVLNGVSINDFITEKCDLSVVDFLRVCAALRIHVSYTPTELLMENYLPTVDFEKIQEEDEPTEE